MNGRGIDMAIVGGGLAGGLAALAVSRARPDLRLALIEAGGTLGGNHRWSWFASDLAVDAAALLSHFPTTAWDAGYDVVFPDHRRTLSTPYRSLASGDFDAALRQHLPKDAIRLNARAVGVDAAGVTLDSGERLPAGVVVDCRDFEPSPHLSGGWQVFVGRHLRMAAPHRLTRPIVMDATVGQPGAYRFVYTLPLGAEELFIEDTYYADCPTLDRDTLSRRIENYCAARGWQGETIGEEAGVLPVITGGDFAHYRRDLGPPGVVRIGVRGGFAHPLTSYTLPFAVANALLLAAEAGSPGARIADRFERRAADHWRAMRFYRRLGRMLFHAANPSRRYRIFERFYRLPEPLIERFYAGRSSPADKVRVLTGKPPVPITGAVRALLGKGNPLVHGDSR